MTEPIRSIMTACEVLTWIAFRRAITREQLRALFKVSLERWACVPADAVLEALEARAGVSGDGPYYAIRWAKDSYHSDRSAHTEFSPKGPSMLRWIRRQHRRTTGTLVSFSALAHLLREEIAADERTSQQLKEAKIQLCDRAASGLLVAYGISLDSDGNLSAGASVQAIPATVFKYPAITITEWDEVHADTTKPIKYWHNKKLPQFEDIQFNTSEVLALWPPDSVRPHVAEAGVGSATAKTAAPTGESGHSPKGRPPRHDWDAFWIEVVIYAALNGLDEEHRQELRILMEKWTAEHSENPPDETTTRKKLARLYQTARNRV
jgi:hypothetical protein